MTLSRNADVAAVVVQFIEGEPVRGGDLLVKPMIAGDEMTMLETFFPRGVRAPVHVHQHESVLYVVKGRLQMFVGSEQYVLGPGDACRHPKGVSHRIEAIEDSTIIEVKSPTPDLRSLFGAAAR